jgi:hypothetical protein
LTSLPSLFMTNAPMVIRIRRNISGKRFRPAWHLVLEKTSLRWMYSIWSWLLSTSSSVGDTVFIFMRNWWKWSEKNSTENLGELKALIKGIVLKIAFHHNVCTKIWVKISGLISLRSIPF